MLERLKTAWVETLRELKPAIERETGPGMRFGYVQDPMGLKLRLEGSPSLIDGKVPRVDTLVSTNALYDFAGDPKGTIMAAVREMRSRLVAGIQAQSPAAVRISDIPTLRLIFDDSYSLQCTQDFDRATFTFTLRRDDRALTRTLTQAGLANGGEEYLKYELTAMKAELDRSIPPAFLTKDGFYGVRRGVDIGLMQTAINGQFATASAAVPLPQITRVARVPMYMRGDEWETQNREPSRRKKKPAASPAPVDEPVAPRRKLAIGDIG